ncbi:MAG: hypothetical protein FGM37_08550 [Phycisphaerales bacterium]|nr:hypothetical protein [Phycisphaerales bacterium]
MASAAHIHGEGTDRAAFGCGSRSASEPGTAESLARNLGRMCGHIAAAIRTPVVPQPESVIARRVSQCDAPGPDGTTLRRTVVDEIVAPAADSNTLRDHHAS